MDVNETETETGRSLLEIRTNGAYQHANRRMSASMRQLLWWLIGGSRGGKNRLRIIRTLHDRPMNTNQLANDLDLNYRTVQHHLEMLVENGVLTTAGEEYGQMFFLSDQMEQNLDLLEEIAAQASLDETEPGGDDDE